MLDAQGLHHPQREEQLAAAAEAVVPPFGGRENLWTLIQELHSLHVFFFGGVCFFLFFPLLLFLLFVRFVSSGFCWFCSGGCKRESWLLPLRAKQPSGRAPFFNLC